ncbi:MAG: DUF1292 domain-containing protein [Bacilli bacterium]|jgi:uncharacterized protein YrzB (UPF0473 family)|nr:DUF1292 domain-containing protein [Bacilli bacterium]
MENKEMIKIVDELGAEKEVEVVSYFNLKSNNKDYLIYTENKVDASGNVEVYTSEVVNSADGSIELKGIDDDAVWSEIKKVMLDIAKDGE